MGTQSICFSRSTVVTGYVCNWQLYTGMILLLGCNKMLVMYNILSGKDDSLGVDERGLGHAVVSNEYYTTQLIANNSVQTQCVQ